jgi:cell division protein CrgA
MPKSKSKRRRYQAPPRKKPKPSPKWYGATLLGLMLAGVALIVLNYVMLLPGADARGDYRYLFGGLGLIALGFLGATQWR